jgi:hypothetical protein
MAFVWRKMPTFASRKKNGKNASAGFKMPLNAKFAK